MKQRLIHQGLQIAPMMDKAQEPDELPLVLLIAPPGVPKDSQRPSLHAMDGDSVVRGRAPGRTEVGRPGSSQNICARL